MPTLTHCNILARVCEGDARAGRLNALLKIAVRTTITRSRRAYSSHAVGHGKNPFRKKPWLL